MSGRRRFLKSIAGALVASAMPKSMLTIGEPQVQVTFYEKSMEKHRKRLNEQFEKAIWAGNLSNLEK
jgi:hypothetical protein